MFIIRIVLIKCSDKDWHSSSRATSKIFIERFIVIWLMVDKRAVETLHHIQLLGNIWRPTLEDDVYQMYLWLSVD